MRGSGILQEDFCYAGCEKEEKGIRPCVQDKENRRTVYEGDQMSEKKKRGSGRRGSPNRDAAKHLAEAKKGKQPIDGTPRCLEVAEKGIRTGADFALFMSHLMSDLVSGRIHPKEGNAAINAGGKLLKVVEMRYRLGVRDTSRDPQDILLTDIKRAS